MRYLWIEDFNDGSFVEDELKERLENFFDLKNDKLIVKKDLSSAILFLEEKENLHEIDAFLIDIRFPEGKIEKLYEKYFSEIVTNEFYEEHVNDASGIMLYLLLIFRYHISQSKIAFISANISSDESKIKYINNMLELIAKHKYAGLSTDEMNDYYSEEVKLKRIIRTQEEKHYWDRLILKEEEGKYKIDECVDVEKLGKTLTGLPLKYHGCFNEVESNNNSLVKYNDVKAKFNKIGLSMPDAFEKPKGEQATDKRYSFIEWEDRIYANNYNAIRSNVLEMCLVLIKNLKKSQSNSKLYDDFINLLSCNREEKMTYDADFFIRYLKNLMGLFSMECTESYNFFSERFVKEIASLWEAALVPKYRKPGAKKSTPRMVELDRNKAFHNDHCFYACHATMKLVRNWIGHQGINEINVMDAGLLFIICMRGIFNINYIETSSRDVYEACERRILDMFDKDANIKPDITASFKYICELNNSTKDGNNISTDIYERISGLGHSCSTIRRNVSMDEIYMLLYHTLCKENNTGMYLQVEEAIKYRTWKNWRERYDSRFSTYIK